MVQFLRFILAAFFLIPNLAYAETLGGVVTDATDSQPIIGAAVSVVGTKYATVTDIDGNFELNAPEGAQLQVSYVGYKNEEFEARNGMKIEIHEDSESLE